MTPMISDPPDVRVVNHGTVLRFHLISDRARAWVEENAEVPDWARTGENTFGADHRPGRRLAQGMEEAGLAVAWRASNR